MSPEIDSTVMICERSRLCSVTGSSPHASAQTDAPSAPSSDTTMLPNSSAA
ncbi:hypothetical protein [Microcella alkaliphila]|uniref:hypothetical protein n=1 Tax=Microcella alkaliphila TaxID=279828 RepID=UPI0013007EEF|nr:hypothetical protein [Microcella alkaliphila]